MQNTSVECCHQRLGAITEHTVDIPHRIEFLNTEELEAPKDIFNLKRTNLELALLPYPAVFELEHPSEEPGASSILLER
jgi:hypothetical protein